MIMLLLTPPTILLGACISSTVLQEQSKELQVLGDTYEWDVYKYMWDRELDPTAVGELELSWAVTLAPTSLYVIHSDFPIPPDHNSCIKKKQTK